MSFVRCLLVLGVGVLLACGVACKKSAKNDESAPFTIAGAAEVVSALERKDYEAAVSVIPEVKAGLPEDRTAKEWIEYRRLQQKLKDEMIEAMGTNESAKKAFEMLRILETGR